MSDPIRILIVEDDVATATMFRDMLEHAGYIISGHATNGAQGIAMTTALQPDVVLMDIKMPGMDGITCAETILKQCPTPVIIISGYDDPRLVERAKRSGVGAYLVKPIKLADLQRSIVLVLARFQDLMKLRHLAAIMECSQDAVFSITPDGIVLTWNSAAERIYGYSADEISGKSMALLFPPDRSDEFDRLLKKIKRGEQVKVYETVMTGQHGKYIAVSVSLALIRDVNGSVIFAAAIIRDITERKVMQEKLLASERLAVMGRLVADLSHELNNPLAIIAGNMSLLEEMVKKQVTTIPDSENNLKRFEKIKKAINSCKKIMAALLVSTRPTILDIKPTDMNKLIEESLKSMDDRLKSQNVKVVKDFAPRLPMIEADGHRLSQVFINMFSNACDAMPKGGKLMIATRLHTSEAGAPCAATGKESLAIEIEISDTGEGIGENELFKIFDPFVTTKMDGKGVGLGLPISAGIVKEHGGDISVTSKKGKGAVFIIRIPYRTSCLQRPGVSLPG